MKKSFRMIEWLLISLALLALIYWVSPQQLPVVIYKLALLTTSAWVAYWIDRTLFPYARPDASNMMWLQVAGQIRRAIIVGAAMIAVSIGL
ncbi:MAG: putative holin [Gammaproteobacteria bacterium]|nr:putative holin [Gammaproteobacteria bacterium]MBU1978607.1 putative holin [Gammaproteobacteria bacterium]